jgi:RNA polymerase sigma-70 factor (ECF subfamily)
MSALCDRYADHALRVLARILGEDSELLDLQQDVLLRVVRSAASIDDPSSLKGWITVIAVNVARTALKRRSLRRWLTLRPWNELPDVEAPMAAESDVLALRRTYAILARLPVTDRIAFTLRIIDGMELTEVAHACGISLATAKRRLARAEEKFTTMALTDPVLADWLKGGSRWGTR